MRIIFGCLTLIRCKTLIHLTDGIWERGFGAYRPQAKYVPSPGPLTDSAANTPCICWPVHRATCTVWFIAVSRLLTPLPRPFCASTALAPCAGGTTTRLRSITTELISALPPGVRCYCPA